MRKSLFSSVLIAIAVLCVPFVVASFTYADNCKCVPSTCVGAPTCDIGSGGSGHSCYGCRQFDVGPCADGSNGQHCTNRSSDLTCGQVGWGDVVTLPKTFQTCLGQCDTYPSMLPCGGGMASGGLMDACQ